MSIPIRVLIFEDSPDDALLIVEELRCSGYEPSYERVETELSLTQALDRGSWDLVISDYSVPGFNGMAALALVKERGLDLPFILVTGCLGEEVAVACIKKGVSDYVLKDHLAHLPVAVQRALEEKALREKRVRAEEALRQVNVELKRLVSDLEGRAQADSLVNQLGTLLLACLSEEEASKVIRLLVPKLFPGESGAIYMFNPSVGLLEASVVWGEFPLGESVFEPRQCWAVRRGEVHLVIDSTCEVPCKHFMPPPAASCLCVPLIAQGEAMGVLSLQSSTEELSQPVEVRQRLMASRQPLAVTIAGQIGLALANLRLRDRLRSQAIRDPLTGLFNRRYLDERLERELRRAAYDKGPVGLIMLDLDRLKACNDSFGHEAGDTLLRAVGSLLQEHTRSEDLACRYGGDEFALVLPKAPLDITRQRAEELRNEFKHLNVRYGNHVLGTFSLSLGISTFPDHGTSPKALLQEADKALYQAKAGGGNRVVVGQTPRLKS